MIVRQPHIRAVTSKLLSRSHMRRAPVDVESIAKRAGAVLHKGVVAKEISGFLLRHKETPIIGVNIRHPSTRQRFTIAHELGHLFLHDKTGGMSTGVHIDEGFSIKLRDENSSQ